eukprot:1128917-Amphidinium_carterae.1
MRGQRGPDDSPFSEHTFDPAVNYRNTEWGLPVPQEEWERRVYVELNLATDLRYEGKGARPECHACRQRGSREVPLAKCVCFENWACSRHYLVPACLDRNYAFALHTLVWRSDRFRTSRTCASIGSEHLVYRWQTNSLRHKTALCLVYRRLGWVPPTCR